MKKIYIALRSIVFLLCFIQAEKSYTQSISIPYQFYLDANNNCIYDAGETYIYNLPGTLGITYTNTSGSSVSGYTPTAGCGAPLSVLNPSVPAVNYITYTVNPATYPTFSMNFSCPSLSNVSYTATNYFPIKSINQMSSVDYWSNMTGSKNGYLANNIFPVCYNLGSDSVGFSFTVDNLYSCSALNSTRTYSLYFDGIFYDQIIVNASFGYNNVNGAMSNIAELYYTGGNMVYLKTQLPAGISTLGTHSFSLKTTPMFTSSLTAINYSCTLNTVPCTKVSGNAYADCDNNCIKNSADGILSFGAVIKVFNLSSNISLGTDGNGNFSFFAPAGASQYSVCALSSSSTFTSCPANSNTVAIPNGVTTNTLSYGFKVGLVQDLAVAPGIVGSAMPGQIRPIFFSVINMFPTFGCVFTPTPNPGKVKYVLDKSFTYQNAISPTPAPNTIIAGPNGDTLVWNVTDFTTMASYQLYSISVQVSPSVSIGAPFVNYTIVQPLNDLVLSNNQAAFSFSIGIPCDPNNKLCYAQGIQSNGDIPFGTQDLYYTVNFQNIGTAPAINVKTLDTLDMNLDWTSLEVLSSSFPVQTQVDNSTGQTIFYFKNINLPDSTTNEAGSHGFIRYKIKLKPSIPVNTIIKNRAYNYFDFQPPVATNQTKNKLVNMVGIKELELSNSIKLQPNPVSDKLFIFCDEQIKEIVMLNSLGQPISRQEMNAKQAVIEMSNLPAGFYFVNIKTQSGSVLTKKIIKD